MRMRFGLDDGQPRTLEDIGRVQGVTRERIRQIECKALSNFGTPPARPACATSAESGPIVARVPGHDWDTCAGGPHNHALLWPREDAWEPRMSRR